MPDVIYEKHDFYAVFTMNRPESLNAQSVRLGAELGEAVADFNADPAMRVGILTGAGRAFSAGADLKEMAEGDGAEEDNWDDTMFSRSSKPFIAAINGLCIGGGLESALDCDIRICSTEAYFGLFEVKRGITASYAWYHLPRTISAAASNYVLLTGDRISTKQALQFGIVTEVVEPARLMPRAVEIAGLIAQNAPLSVQGTKEVARSWRMAELDDSVRVGSPTLARIMESEDAIEGPTAFAEKRDPQWPGR